MPEFAANEDLARLPGAGPDSPIRPGERPRERRSTVLVRYLDLVLLVVATPIALALGAPLLGFALAAGAWLLQRILAHLDRRWVSRAATPQRQLALSTFEAFGRIWLLAGAIILAGVVGGRADGLTAAVTIFAAYSVAFALRMLDGRPSGGP
jgi:hypothetical protein